MPCHQYEWSAPCWPWTDVVVRTECIVEPPDVMSFGKWSDVVAVVAVEMRGNATGTNTGVLSCLLCRSFYRWSHNRNVSSTSTSSCTAWEDHSSGNVSSANTEKAATIEFISADPFYLALQGSEVGPRIVWSWANDVLSKWCRGIGRAVSAFSSRHRREVDGLSERLSADFQCRHAICLLHKIPWAVSCQWPNNCIVPCWAAY